jgi:DUF1680 family protein
MVDTDIERPVSQHRAALPGKRVTVTDDFWGERRRINRERTLDRQYDLLDGRLENLRRAAGEADGGFEGPYHNDPPVYKWIEAASDALETEPDQELRERLDAAVDTVVAAQDDDGYLHSYFILEHEPADRWTNLGVKHELFALGHLVEAALAHHHATGQQRLLATARRFADHACTVFGPDGNTGYPGHPGVELALVSLYRATGADRYLELARFFVDERGRDDSRFEWELANESEVAGDPLHELYCAPDGSYDGRYAQDHAPLREQATVEGHAVKATFLFSGATALAAETGDEQLLAAMDRLHDNMTRKRMYVTGGIGADHDGESFGGDYELPNATAYAETCAAFGNVRWNHHLSRVLPGSRFADVIERTLYNGFLAGTSLDGTRFAYTNPLASGGGRHRKEWYHTSCCPPNVARLLASLERYLYLRDDTTLYVEQYVGSEADLSVRDTAVSVTQESAFPWRGDVEFNVSTGSPVEFTLALRVPEWCESPTVTARGESLSVETDGENGYARIAGKWSGDEHVTVRFPMAAKQRAANPAVAATVGKHAVRRGPLVYCVEADDAPCPVDSLLLPESPGFESRHEDRLGGVTTLSVQGEQPALDGPAPPLYGAPDSIETEPAPFTAIPYYAWDNREPGAMRVWLRAKRPFSRG